MVPGPLLLPYAAGLTIAACPAPPPTPPPAAPAGCYVVLGREHLTGPPLELLFPAFFQLDTARRQDGTGRVVKLPRDDQARFASGWSWIRSGEEVELGSAGPDQGFRLRLRPGPETWDGLLDAWLDDTATTWRLEGRRVACPPGLVPAG